MGEVEEKTLIKDVLHRHSYRGNVLFGNILKGCGTKTVHQQCTEGWQVAGIQRLERAYVSCEIARFD